MRRTAVLALVLVLGGCAGPDSDPAPLALPPVAARVPTHRAALRADAGGRLERLADTSVPRPEDTDHSRAVGRPSRSKASGSHQGAKSLAEIKQCESGGDYRAVSRSGRYTGAYQVDRSTWGGYGGYATAGEAPPEVQDAWAAELQRTRGNRPWPVCGR